MKWGILGAAKFARQHMAPAIHAAKGGECDNVLLTTDMNIKTYQSYQKDSDDEQRVFYVGATRAKEELHVLLPQTTMHFKLAL